jgi:hypothetical protein
MAAKWTDFVAGAVLTAAQLNSVLDNFSDIAIFNETQASGTDGGTFTQGAYQKRTLNTTVVNNIASCTLTSSVISLPAGTYYIRANAPWWGTTGVVQARIANTTDSTYSYGQTGYGQGGIGMVGGNIVETVVTITGTKNFELQHRCATTVTTNGYGIGATFGNSVIFSTITIARIA